MAEITANFNTGETNATNCPTVTVFAPICFMKITLTIRLSWRFVPPDHKLPLKNCWHQDFQCFGDV